MDMLPLEPGSPFEGFFLPKTPVEKWDIDDVAEWLGSLGCGEYASQFRSNHIDGPVLLVLDRKNLSRMIKRVGDRLKVQKAAMGLQVKEVEEGTISANLTGTGGFSSLVTTPVGMQDISVVYPDGKTRIVGVSASLTSSTDVKHLILRQVFPTIAKATASSAWALSRGDRVLTDAEVVALATEPRETRPPLRIHQVDPPAATISRQRSAHRPSSRHVSAHLREYFPNVPSGELEQTVRNSVMLTRRLSTYDPGAIHERRLSNIVGGSGGATVGPRSRPSSHTPPEAQQAQQLLDQFRAEEFAPTRWIRGQMIGSGSFGTVYMGMNAFTGELLAVKQVEIPNSEIDEGRKKKMVDALKHEVQLMRGFDHENIVQYRGFKHEDDSLNIFLEYVPGGSLVSMLNQYGSFEETLVSHYVGQILAGLEYLHQRKVIHRDIKGANILVDDKGHCKISDFGLSKKMETQQLLKSSRQSMQGSTFWMAPEVVKQMAPTIKSDIWSLGCVVVELLTGSHPFPQLTQIQAIFKLGNMMQPEIPNDCSAEAKSFLRKTLEVDPDKRPNATELRQHPFAVPRA